MNKQQTTTRHVINVQSRALYGMDNVVLYLSPKVRSPASETESTGTLPLGFTSKTDYIWGLAKYGGRYLLALIL
jgi:hypothetical protein